MGSSSQGIALEQLGQDHTGLAIGNISEPQIYSSSNGITSQIDSAKKTYGVLNCLIQVLSPAHSLDTLLHSLADLTRQVMQMDLCVVMLVDPAYSSLSLRAASPDLTNYEISLTPIASDRIPWKKLLVFNTEGQLPILTGHEQEQLNPLKQVQYETLLVVPLVVGNDYLGLLNCYSSKNRACTLEDLILLRSIISQGALAIQNRQLVHTPGHNELRPYIKAFFDDLLSDYPDTEDSLRGRANYLGCDLTRPHSMLIIEIIQANVYGRDPENLSPGNQQIAFKHAARFMKHRIQEHFPGSLVNERENMLFCIMPFDRTEELHIRLRDLIHQVQLEQHIQMFFGVGNPYLDIHGYKKGFAEAEEALRIGQHLKREGAGMHFNNLGAYRYIYEFACSNKLDDPYLEKIAAITSYDQQRKGSELLDTLEIFLEVGGNILDTSRRLHVHRNTIIQRLKHIRSLCAVDLDQPDLRLRLQMALMIDKLRKN